MRRTRSTAPWTERFCPSCWRACCPTSATRSRWLPSPARVWALRARLSACFSVSHWNCYSCYTDVLSGTVPVCECAAWMGLQPRCHQHNVCGVWRCVNRGFRWDNKKHLGSSASISLALSLRHIFTFWEVRFVLFLQELHGSLVPLPCLA